jgi:hypothetical protein
MDFLSGGLMKDHIFSISTVSGSSVGLGSVLSYWTFCKEANLELGEQRWRLYPSKVFKYNFVGGSILGLTVTDFFNSLIPGPKRASDRNAELQREEAVCVQRSIKEAYSKKPLNKFNLFKRKDGYSADSLIMCRDFLSFFYDKLGPDSITKIKADLPLCFINTCRSNDGRRGIFSPVILGNKDFIDAIDLTRYIYSSGFKNDTQQVRGLGKAISLGTACNTSELFPFFSAPAFIDNLGYFVDGGYHENSGLKTTMEIYYKLKSLLDASNLKDSSDYTISIIYLKNGKYDKKYYPEVLKPTLPGLQPLVALSNIPFNGNASYFEETASNELKGNFIRFQLDYGKLLDSSKGEITKKLVDAAINKEILDDISSVQLVEYKDSTNTIKSRMDTTLNFPLARWLSNYIITRLRDNCDYVCQTEKKLQALINLINPESRRVEYPAQPPEKK